MSLPSRERGLKFGLLLGDRAHLHVAPFTGAWIEIVVGNLDAHRLQVAPFTGAWIEIVLGEQHLGQMTVAPFTGAWIEIR